MHRRNIVQSASWHDGGAFGPLRQSITHDTHIHTHIHIFCLLFSIFFVSSCHSLFHIPTSLYPSRSFPTFFSKSRFVQDTRFLFIKNWSSCDTLKSYNIRNRRAYLWLPSIFLSYPANVGKLRKKVKITSWTIGDRGGKQIEREGERRRSKEGCFHFRRSVRKIVCGYGFWTTLIDWRAIAHSSDRRVSIRPMKFSLLHLSLESKLNFSLLSLNTVAFDICIDSISSINDNIQ